LALVIRPVVFWCFLEKPAEPPVATSLVAERAQLLEIRNNEARRQDLVPAGSANLV
jgi:hypothetical protein